MIFQGLILVLLLGAVPINSLYCYECSCDTSNQFECDCGYATESNEQDYCVILESRGADSTYVYLYRIPRNATWLYVEDSYFILTIETISYNTTAADWYTWPSQVMYGCDWDLCNSPSLINTLPNSFQLSIDKTWLTTNIYGTGTINNCHTCTSQICTDAGGSFNSSQCPLTPCLNATSCFAMDLWTDLETGEQCYRAECAPAYLDAPGAEFEGGKYRIDIEAIVYLAQDRSTYDVWEIDVYCAAFNCTRSTIFQEIRQQLSGDIGDLSAFPSVRPETITCYQCDCLDSVTCPCTNITTISRDDGYCAIIRESFGQNVYIYHDGYSYADSGVYISEFPYVFVEESISYEEVVGLWFTRTDLVVYGCNWNLCNKPGLAAYLPSSFQMRLPEVWLNSSVLGTGQPARDCHECPDGGSCGTIDYLDSAVCPIQSCNTTCLVQDLYDDPAHNYICYQSYCVPPADDSDPAYHHRIDIGGAVYASQQNVVEIWEVDIYCRANNCSSPTIFRELHEQLTVQAGNLAALFNETYDPTIPQRRCYECSCSDAISCTCDRTTVRPADSTYCIIERMNVGQTSYIDLGHIDRASTRIYIRDFPYLLLEETISYSEQTAIWNTVTNYIIYGCDWDYCNDPSLVPYLPASFQMRLPVQWLNNNVLGTGQPIRDCHECPEAPQCGTLDFLDASRCPIRACNTTCIVSDTYDDPANNLQCYQSRCVPIGGDNDPYDRHRIEIEGILYLSKQPRSVELWEVDIFCRADNCSQLEIFTELRDQLSVEYGDVSVFERVNSTVTTTAAGATTTTAAGATTTTAAGATTTAAGATTTAAGTTLAPSTQPTTTGHASIITSSSVLVILLISIFSLNFY